MSDWNQPHVLDREAYQERMAIMLEEAEAEFPGEAWRSNHATSAAADGAYKTPFAIVATAAARGDWDPAKEMCRAERETHGEEWARDLMREIQAAVRETMEMRGSA